MHKRTPQTDADVTPPQVLTFLWDYWLGYMVQNCISLCLLVTYTKDRTTSLSHTGMYSYIFMLLSVCTLGGLYKVPSVRRSSYSDLHFKCFKGEKQFVVSHKSTFSFLPPPPSTTSFAFLLRHAPDDCKKTLKTNVLNLPLQHSRL